ncbi:hypothetical protein LSH36_53g00033 [Paralvinella palmiformis]|uniref:Uncharacterized protein n=1 Tax=Paralvinella palmiformis TaxID=53620 RepID=A0AAD9K5E0_9ANNE|nr:hypothetical protein LSH36_53g00033 [Paralvinella palmiformis]
MNLSFIGDVTLVTGYFNIGPFIKGHKVNRRKPSDYEDWVSSFRRYRNPVVGFFDPGDPLVDRFREARKHLGPLTKIVEIDRNQLWTFKILGNVSSIFNSSGYPRHYPNTVNPQYACVTSSRFELLQRVIEGNLFESNHLAWIDIGYFKNPECNLTFKLPPDFQENSVAFTEVKNRNSHLSPLDIIRRNRNWVAAGYFVAHHKVMHQFVTGYLTNLRYFLEQGVMSAEQQMIYSMVNTNVTTNRLPEIQTYNRKLMNIGIKCSRWCFLGCICAKQVVDK